MDGWGLGDGIHYSFMSHEHSISIYYEVSRLHYYLGARCQVKDDNEMMTLLVSQNTSMGFVGTFAVAGIEQMDDIEGTE